MPPLSKHAKPVWCGPIQGFLELRRKQREERKQQEQKKESPDNEAEALSIKQGEP